MRQVGVRQARAVHPLPPHVVAYEVVVEICVLAVGCCLSPTPPIRRPSLRNSGLIPSNVGSAHGEPATRASVHPRHDVGELKETWVRTDSFGPGKFHTSDMLRTHVGGPGRDRVHAGGEKALARLLTASWAIDYDNYGSAG
jgi:hypothetical protein